MLFDDYTGFITPFVLEKIMGSTGAYLLITSITMALMSTGSGEVMAVSSIVVYDIYKVYINPFRYLASPFWWGWGMWRNCLSSICDLCCGWICELL